jgi:hypothetical protein
LYLAYPDQDLTLFVDGQLSQAKLFAYFIQQRIIETKGVLEPTVCHPPLALEQPYDSEDQFVEPTLSVYLTLYFWLRGASFASPYQHLTVLVHSELVDFDEFILKNFQVIVIQFELEFQCPI